MGTEKLSVPVAGPAGCLSTVRLPLPVCLQSPPLVSSGGQGCQSSGSPLGFLLCAGGRGVGGESHLDSKGTGKDQGWDRMGGRDGVPRTERCSQSHYLSGQRGHCDDCYADAHQRCGHGSKQWDLEPSAVLSR